MAAFGFGLGIGFARKKPGDPDASAYYAQLSTQPTPARKVIINTLITTLKADGNWTKLDRLWLHASETQQAATISLVNPSSTAITEVNTPAWVADQGYTGNGTTSYLNTNYNPSTQGSTLTLNSASIGVYSRTDSGLTSNDIGCDDGTNFLQILAKFTDTNFYGRVNEIDATVLAGVAADSLALSTVARTTSGAEFSYKRGVQLGTEASSSSAIPSKNIFICCRNVNDTPLEFSTRQYSISFIGSGAINQLTFYNAIQTYMTSLGTQV